MKKKKAYIAPDIKVIEMERGSIMAQSWRVYDNEGNLIDNGHVIEGDLPTGNTAKDANPFSGDWEL